MSLFRSFLLLVPACVLAIASPALAQRAPRIGYVFPAGGQQGESFEVTLGGQFLNGASDVVVSGNGVRANLANKHARAKADGKSGDSMLNEWYLLRRDFVYNPPLILLAKNNIF